MNEEHVKRVRRIYMALADSSEKLSHGAPTFFVRKRVFCMFANNHHNDGHVAAWLPAEPGVQAALIRTFPEKYYSPPYVGVKGWIGVELEEASDEELAAHIQDAWRLIAAKRR